MPRDRLNELLTTANIKAAVDDDEPEVSIKTPFKFKKEVKPPPPDFLEAFFKEVTEIKENINSIKIKVGEVKKLQKSILSAPHVDGASRNSLDEKMNEIKKLSQVVNKQLKDLDAEAKEDELANEELGKKEAGKLHQADLRMKKLQHSALMQLFKNTMLDYSDCQVEYREQFKKRIEKSLHIIANKDMSEAEIENILEKGTSQIFAEQYIENTTKAKQDLQELEERHQDLTKLERSIQELRDLFVELSGLVSQQGEMIDRIESNVQETNDYIESAVSHTDKAVKSQSKSRKKKFCIIGCAVIGALLLIIIITVSVVKS